MPVDKLLAEPDTPTALRQALQNVEEIRDFADEALALPVEDSYSGFVELEREAVVWNLLVAPYDSLELKAWCYLVIGCQTYRGYFARRRAEDAASAYSPERWDTWIAGVPAYSSLGWFDDPALSTFVYWPEDQLAALLFHELSHRVVYTPGDTAFNESYATTVELEGLLRYLNHSKQQHLIPRALARQQTERAFVNMVMQSAMELRELYQQPGLSRIALLREKERLLDTLRARYDQQRRSWLNPDAYSAFFDAGLNNARIASVGTYNRWVPAFRRLLHLHDGDFQLFHQAVRELARLPATERRRRLEALESAALPDPPL